MTTLIFVRHGESIKNTLGIVQGADADDSNVLSPRGVEQAHNVAYRFKDIPTAAIYSSPMARARMTAEIIGAAFGIKPSEYPALHEKKQGSMQGMKSVDMLARYGSWDEMTEDERLDIKSVPDEETQRELRSRSMKVIDDLVTMHPGQATIAVTHGGFMRSLYTYLAGKTLKDMWQFRNCGYMILAKTDTQWSIVDTHDLHLKVRDSGGIFQDSHITA